MTITEYFGDWSKVVDLKEADRLIKVLSKSEQIVCPDIRNIFKSFHLCPLESLRVVILGQDPYCTLKQGKVPVATGIAFANSPDTPENSYSPSLNILMDSVIDFTVPHKTITFDSSLGKWEEQGVLMLNSALSCLAGNSNSHALMWRPFMKSLLSNLSMHTTGIVYVLMGTQAQSFDSFISHQFNHVIHIRHPSWYARNQTRMPSSVWKNVNSILEGQNGYGIEWYQEY